MVDAHGKGPCRGHGRCHAGMLRDALDALSECAEYLAEREDVVDGSDGQPRPNEAMSLLLSIDRTIAKLHKAVGRV